MPRDLYGRRRTQLLPKRRNTVSKEQKNRFVTADEIITELQICDRTLGNWIKAGKFPAPLRLSLRKRVWMRSTVENFYNAKAAEAAGEK